MKPTKIRVSGKHTISMPPERGTVRVTIALEGPDPEQVVAAVQAALETVQVSIMTRHHETSGPVTWFSVNQVTTSVRRPTDRDGHDLAPVHQARVSVRVRFTDFTELGRWISWTASVNGLKVDHVDWTLTRARRLDVVRSARTRAVEDAAARAGHYAAALGLDAPVIRSLAEGEGSHIAPHTRGYLEDTILGAAPQGFQLEPEEVEVTASVHATFVASPAA